MTECMDCAAEIPQGLFYCKRCTEERARKPEPAYRVCRSLMCGALVEPWEDYCWMCIERAAKDRGMSEY